MKLLKMTLITALFFASVIACEKQDLNKADMESDIDTTMLVLYSGGQGHD